MTPGSVHHTLFDPEENPKLISDEMFAEGSMPDMERKKFESLTCNFHFCHLPR